MDANDGGTNSLFALAFGRLVPTPLDLPRLFVIKMRPAQTRISKGVRDSTYKTCLEKSRFYTHDNKQSPCRAHRYNWQHPSTASRPILLFVSVYT